ncbi:glycosyltransferase family 87 protein [Butyrivibrio sp. YAB3001]|uniref:glycosyltransferase family 87 protein n=1 Tax=Butyrivibrio sp. YAB3001 TaxID=1520812 RepID=UPI0008F66257|nr:glycosyltransferase family 87 protein [Butyrivibrio sp. YAB3001]SFC76894.1 Protein of unknown function [Butyrivibrio sp. YAB3001]
MQRFKNILNPFNIFVGINIIGFSLYLIYGLLIGGKASDWLLMENTDLKFCDFSMHLAFVADRANLYFRAPAFAGCFPPLVYVMYSFFYHLIAREGILPQQLEDIEQLPYFNLIVLYYSIIVILALLYGIYIYGNNSKKKNIVLFLTLLFSVPFMAGGMFVANSTLLVMALLVIAIKLRKSDNAASREFALLLIAICAGFKIYPAVFGILYLLEKRWKEAARLTGYGIVLFFAPFSLFGGMTGFKQWLFNVRSTTGVDKYGRIQSIRGLAYTTLEHFGLGGNRPTLLRLVPILFFVFMLVMICIVKSEYRRMFFICCIMTFFSNNSYRYTLCYLAIPLIIFFLEEDDDSVSGKEKVLRCIEMAIYSMVFAIPMLWGFLTNFKLTYPYPTLTYVEMIVYVWAYILMAYVTVSEIWKQLKYHK